MTACPDRTRAVRWFCALCGCYGDHGVGVGWVGANNVTCTAHLNDTTLSALLHAAHVTLSELQANGVRLRSRCGIERCKPKVIIWRVAGAGWLVFLASSKRKPSQNRLPFWLAQNVVLAVVLLATNQQLLLGAWNAIVWKKAGARVLPKAQPNDFDAKRVMNGPSWRLLGKLRPTLAFANSCVVFGESQLDRLWHH